MMSRPRRISRNLWKYIFSLTVSDTSLLDAYRDHVYVSYGTLLYPMMSGIILIVNGKSQLWSTDRSLFLRAAHERWWSGVSFVILDVDGGYCCNLVCLKKLQTASDVK